MLLFIKPRTLDPCSTLFRLPVLDFFKCGSMLHIYSDYKVYDLNAFEICIFLNSEHTLFCSLRKQRQKFLVSSH